MSTGEEFYVDFFVQTKRKGNHTTVCRITDVENKDYFVEGFALCNKKDKYNKAIGKAKALQRAINLIYPIEDTTKTFENKTLRQQIWRVFFNNLHTQDKSRLAGIEKWQKC